MLVLQLIIDGLLIAGIYLLLAQGMNLIFGVMRIVNFAHGALMAMGGVVTFWVTLHTKINPILGIFIAVIGSFIIGVLVERLLLAPVSEQSSYGELLTLLVTYGFGFLAINLTILLFGAQFVSLPYLQHSWVVGGIHVLQALVVCGVVALLLSAFLYFWLRKTTMGKVMVASSENVIGAELCGIDVSKVRIIAFGMGSALAGLAGGLYVFVIPIGSSGGNGLTVLAFLIIALGGLGDYVGTIAAAVIVGVLQEIVGYVGGGEWQSLLPYLLLLAVLLLRPQGLRGVRMIEA